MINKFEWLCSLLPADVNWSDPITPDIVEQIVLAEREACAKVCERQAGEEHNADHNSACADCAAEIRARPNKG